MKTLGEQFAALNQISKGKAPAADIATQAEVLRITAGVAKSAFTPKVLGGEAKPEVWDKWDDFSKRLDDLVAAATDVSKAAKQGGVAAVTPKLSSLSCKGCHDVYRVQKK
jgi:cytochrome c556